MQINGVHIKYKSCSTRKNLVLPPSYSFAPRTFQPILVLGAVSYTHLDVYKRQGLHLSRLWTHQRSQRVFYTHARARTSQALDKGQVIRFPFLYTSYNIGAIKYCDCVLHTRGRKYLLVHLLIPRVYAKVLFAWLYWVSKKKTHASLPFMVLIRI